MLDYAIHEINNIDEQTQNLLCDRMEKFFDYEQRKIDELQAKYQIELEIQPPEFDVYYF